MSRLANFKSIASKLALHGNLQLMVDHQRLGTLSSETMADCIGIILVASDETKTTCALVHYEDVDSKKDETTLNIVKMVCEKLNLIEALESGALPVVCDGALFNCAKSMSSISPAYICIFHSMNRLAENCIEYLQGKFTFLT